MPLWLFLLLTWLPSARALRGCAPPELLPGRPFVVAWNSPFFVCRWTHTFNLSDYGILNNPYKNWMGEYMTVFYGLGTWPRINKDWSVVNGGIPQLMNLTAHLDKCKIDITWNIPNASHVGLGVIDMESWRPLTSLNWGGFRAYTARSTGLVRQQHPHWPQKAILDEAARQFDQAAKQALLETLKLAQELRPNIRWGYYYYPNCFGGCGKFIYDSMDRMSWLFSQSSALYPSIYYEPRVATIKESLAVHAKFSRPSTHVMPYTVIQSGPLRFHQPEQLDSGIKVAADLGASGVVIWGSSFNYRARGACQALADYLHSTLGPYISALSRQASLCSQQLCSGHGRCILTKYAWDLEQNFKERGIQDSSVVKPTRRRRRGRPISSQRLMSVNVADTNRSDQFRKRKRETSKNDSTPFEDYTCRCYEDWGGTDCSVYIPGLC